MRRHQGRIFCRPVSRWALVQAAMAAATTAAAPAQAVTEVQCAAIVGPALGWLQVGWPTDGWRRCKVVRVRPPGGKLGPDVRADRNRVGVGNDDAELPAGLVSLSDATLVTGSLTICANREIGAVPADPPVGVLDDGTAVHAWREVAVGPSARRGDPQANHHQQHDRPSASNHRRGMVHRCPPLWSVRAGAERTCGSSAT